MNKISVVMSVYNTKEEWLRKSIESILNQSFKDFEFIIILDAPTDHSEDIVKEYAQKDSRIYIVKNEKNLGLTKSLNIGIKKATGKYIARIDSDDISTVERFQKQVKYLDEHQDVAVVGAYVSVFDENKNYSIGMNNTSSNNEKNKIRMIFCNAGVAHSTAMIRKEFLLENNISYDEGIKKAQDYALWTDIVLKNGRIDIIKEILLEYRIHSGQITQQCSNEQVQCMKKIMRKQINYYFNFNPTLKELNIHFKLFRDYSMLEKKETERYLNKILESNRNTKRIDEALLKTEIYSMWLYAIIVKTLKNKDFSLIFSKITLKAFRPRYIYCAFLKRKSNKEYKKILYDYCKENLKE